MVSPWITINTIPVTHKYCTCVIMGMVFVGTGTVWEIPTHGIPMPNPICWISRIPTEYSLCVSIGPPDSPSNIIWVILLDQPDTHQIFIGCIHWSAWQSIQYWLGDTVRSAGYPNIHWVYLVVNRPVYQILTGWYYQINNVFGLAGHNQNMYLNDSRSIQLL